jgi:uncharacterized repeat protein (TIGR03803 family)
MREVRKIGGRFGAVAGVAALGMLVASTIPAQAQTYKVLHDFGEVSGDGEQPTGGLTLDPTTGSLYGVTPYGGYGGCGVLFKVDPSGKESVVYYFTGETDGCNPYNVTLVRDTAGNLYGTTDSGGAHGWGTVFKTNNSGNLKTLYAFTDGTDGGHPQAGLVLDSEGNLYGTTVEGGDLSCIYYGNPGCGTVFKVDRTGNETVLYSFTNGADGGIPIMPLVRDAAGNLYGTSASGGDVSCSPPYGCGTIFKVDSSGQETVLYTFPGGAGGVGSASALVMDSEENLYDTAFGGTYGAGVVFELDTAGQYTTLYNFTGGTDGGSPYSGLVRDSAGNLYGTTYAGGAHNYGTVFELSAAGVETVLYSFTGERSGFEPLAGLLRSSTGTLYGTTAYGGSYGGGVVFQLKP